MATEEEKPETATKSTPKKNTAIAASGKKSKDAKAANSATDEVNTSQQATQTSAGQYGDSQYFFEDQIFCIDKPGRVKFGLVVETSDSFSDEEDEDDEYEGKLNRGDVRVVFYPSGREHVRRESSIGLADRTLIPGDVVRRMTPGSSPQRGYVRDIKMYADVQVLGTSFVIKNVSSDRLRPLNVWQRDCTVYLDSWVGSVKDVQEKAILKGANGVRFEIQSTDFYHFKEANSNCRASVFQPYIFFAGNIVVGRLPPNHKAKILTPDIPLPMSRKGVMLKSQFKVESVTTDGLIVQWQCKALSKDSSKDISELEPPKANGSTEQLSQVKRLNVFESCVLQIADRSYLKTTPRDQLTTLSKWRKEIGAHFKSIYQEQHNIKGSNKVTSPESKSKRKSMLKDSEKHTTKSTKQSDNSPKKPNESSSSIAVNKITETPAQPVQSTADAEEEDQTFSTEEGDWLDTTCTTDASEHSDVESDDTDVTSVVPASHNQDAGETIVIVDNKPAETDAAGDDGGGGSGGGGGTSIATRANSKKPTASNAKNTGKKQQATQVTRGKQQQQQCVPMQNGPKWASKNSFCCMHSPSKKALTLAEDKEVITETLLVFSTISVVWQDGSVEHDIPSTQLYPIHHLDNHEFFPGDFTMSSRDDPNITFRDYGVIQKVDHYGRTALVKWFKTYAAEDQTFAPIYKGETEISVYDLKDHPDFSYRPGGIVIRVANFDGEDAKCTAGQVLDNCTDGRVKVAWVDGHISSCWPQDLFNVGHHEHNEYSDSDSDSWETQSENSAMSCEDNEGVEINADKTKIQIEEESTVENDIVANVERTRSAIERLESILSANASLQSKNVLRKLLAIHKTGRYMDRLLQTSLFDEINILCLIQRRNMELKDELDASNCVLTPEKREDILRTHEEAMRQRAIYMNTKLPSVDGKKPDIVTSTNIGEALTIAAAVAKLSLPNTGTSGAVVAADTTINSVPPNNIESLQVSAASTSGNEATKATTNGSHDDCDAITPTRYLRNFSYVVRNDANYAQLCGSEPPKSLYIRLTAADLEKLTDEERSQHTGTLQRTQEPPSPSTPFMGSVQYTNLGAEKNHLLSSALLSIEKAFQDGTQAFSRKNSYEECVANDEGNPTGMSAASAATDNAIESASKETGGSAPEIVDAKKRKSLTDGEGLTWQQVTMYVPLRQICVPICTMLKEQLQKCKEEIERRCGKFNINKPLPSAIQSTSGVSENLEVLKKETETKSLPLEISTVTLVTDDVQPEENSEMSGVTTNPNTWTMSEECFKILSCAPKEHKFYTSACEPNQPQQYFRAVQREHRLLKTSLPKGIWIRFYEDRIDLLSVMMEGPKKTPYENGLFFFDMQMARDYPKRPPVCYYISYCVDRLNPNLYEEGKVCVSLLGTWSGRDVEIWGPNSTLLQVLVSIQGLILVPEPYFNEAGYEKQKGSQQGRENSRMYNEMVVIKMVQATMKMLPRPPTIFCEEILEYYKQNGLPMYERIRGWLEFSKCTNLVMANEDGERNEHEEKAAGTADTFAAPDFPLLPASRGFCLTLESLLKDLKTKMEAVANQVTVAAMNSNSPIECKTQDLMKDNGNQP